MPGWLFFFCAEWRRSRRKLQIDTLDSELLQDLAELLGSDGGLPAENNLARLHGLDGWRLDPAEAAEAGLVASTRRDSEPGRSPSNRKTVAKSPKKFNLVLAALKSQAQEKTQSQEDSPGGADAADQEPASPKLFKKVLARAAAQGQPGGADAAEQEPASPKLLKKVLARKATFDVQEQSDQDQPASEPEPLVLPGGWAAIMKLSRAKSRFLAGKSLSGKVNGIKPGSPLSLTFHNPLHPLDGFREECTREEFVQEIRKRLHAERLFAATATSLPAGGGAFEKDTGRRTVEGNGHQTLMALEEAEDLFEALLLVQSPSGGATTLKLGSSMDAMAERFFALTTLRQIVEKGASSMASFFAALDLDRSGAIELPELSQYLQNANLDAREGLGAALVSEGALTVSKMAEAVFNILDLDGNGSIELVELQQQLCLVCPPRFHMVELVGHLEMRHGLGKAGISSSLERAQLFDHFTQREALDISPEDTIHCFRAAGAASGHTPGAGGHGILQNLEAFLKHMPVDVTWGVEPYFADSFYCAMGVRVLMQERSRKKDNCLPGEAVLENAEFMPDQTELRSRFDRLWDRCTGGIGGGEKAAIVEKHLRDACFRRYLESAQAVLDWRARVLKGAFAHANSTMGSTMTSTLDDPLSAEPSHQEAPRRESSTRNITTPRRKKTIDQLSSLQPSVSSTKSRNAPSTQTPTWTSTSVAAEGPRTLFPNIGDLLAMPSARVYSGQVIVVRYRLSGVANFWSSGHLVLKNDREPLAWPVPHKVLGDTPFIGLVPKGLTWTSAGGGGFYLGQFAFTSVDPNLRTDLPRDPATGLIYSFGLVEITVPSLLRTARSKSESKGLSQDFEVRLFCATKSHIIGSVGEPLPVQVIHQMRPPPVESLQVRCEGRCATLRWNILDFGGWHRAGVETSVDCTRLYMHSSKSEHTFTLDPETTEWILDDLSPDTDYEFRIRLENRAGAGREAFAVCRTNALCSAPASLTCAVLGTAHVDLQWPRPKVLGNETTRDQYQVAREAISSYEAALHVVDEGEPDPDTNRPCRWLSGSWREDTNGTIIARLGALRPDTCYSLDGLCAVNSMGKGAAVKSLMFWTVPTAPGISHIRVKHGLVLVALSQMGGSSIKEHLVAVSRTSAPEEKLTFNLPVANQSSPQDDGSLHELQLQFNDMPIAEPGERHMIQLRASNAGGWSEWSMPFETMAITRQQGADQAQALLVKAIQERKIERLARLLEDARDIEFQDETVVNEATNLLEKLKKARAQINMAMAARDPAPLRRAIENARSVQLPDIGKAEALLEKLEGTMSQLNNAKGIDALRRALQGAKESKLPSGLLAGAVTQLTKRVAAQDGLAKAMEAARVPGLAAALQAASGMHLPLEPDAKTLLAELERAETQLRAALDSGLIFELVAALEAVQKSGLLEEELTAEAEELLIKLRSEQVKAQAQLKAAMHARHPVELRQSLTAAVKAQVLQEDTDAASRLLHTLEGLLKAVEDAAGVDARVKSLTDAKAAELPLALLAGAEDQLVKLKVLHEALCLGDVEALRRKLRDAVACGIKHVELIEARVVSQEWKAAIHDVEVAVAFSKVEPLKNALSLASRSGINEENLAMANECCAAMLRRDAAEAKLRDSIESRKIESLQKAVKQACDLDVADCVLITKAHALIEHLQHARAGLNRAVELEDLHTLFDRLNHARAPPSLPTKEVVAAEKLLQDLQHKECSLIESQLRETDDFKVIDAFIERARRAAQAEVRVDESLLTESVEKSQKAQDAERLQMEQQLQQQRTDHNFPRWTHRIPQRHECADVPASVVTGKIFVHFEPAGRYMCTLPREIVEGTLEVMRADVATDSAEEIQGNVGWRKDFLRKIRGMIDPSDDVRELQESPNHIRHRRISINDAWEMHFSIYVRAAHTGVQVAQALCKPGLEVAGECDDEEVGDMEKARSANSQLSGFNDLAREVSSQVFKQMTTSLCEPSSSSSPSKKVRRLADHSRNVRSRVLRKITVDLSWSYPKGIMDTLDASCLVYDSNDLLEIIDTSRYGAGQRGAAVRASHGSHGSPESLNGAVRHVGDETNSDKRTGKQVMELRIDLMPKRVRDIVFVMSACNSRDLSKFSNLQATFYDSVTHAVLASTEIPHAGTTEAAIMCCMYRLEDGLWRMNAFNTLCNGTSRDYRPISAKLLESGYPRNANLRLQVPMLLSTIQSELRAERPVKSTSVTLTSESTLELAYAIELFHDSRPQLMVRQISQQSFMRNLLKALRKAAGERFTERHLEIIAAAFRELRQLQIDLAWEYPRMSAVARSSEQTGKRSKKDRDKGKDKDGMVQALAAEQRERDVKDGRAMMGNFLDGSCMVFEGQALKEVVDYRGPHGVRLVCNGVVDYLGVWTGKVVFGDSTAGAVHHIGEEMNNVSYTGMHSLLVDLDKLPEKASDIFFVLSSPTQYDMSQFTTLRVAVRDKVNPGHEIAATSVQVCESARAVNMGRLARTYEGGWNLEWFGNSSEGNAHNYQPALLCLHAIQTQNLDRRKPAWPHRLGEKLSEDRKPILPRLARACASKDTADMFNSPFSPSASCRDSVSSSVQSTSESLLKIEGSFSGHSMSPPPPSRPSSSRSPGPGRQMETSDRRAAHRASKLSHSHNLEDFR